MEKIGSFMITYCNSIIFGRSPIFQPGASLIAIFSGFSGGDAEMRCLFLCVSAEGVPKGFKLYRVKGQRTVARRSGNRRSLKALLENFAPFAPLREALRQKGLCSRKDAKGAKKY
jgi:hypothetical protein